MRGHLETFLSRAGETGGDGYPRFVEHEFRRYLDCGLLCHGFARLRCAECGYERLAADRQLLTALLGIFLRTLFAWQRRRGRELGLWVARRGR